MVDPGAANRIGQNYQDWLDYFRKGAQGFDPGAFLRGLMPKPPPVTAPEPPPPPPEAAPEAAPAPPAAPAEPGKTPTTLDDFRSERERTRAALAAAEAVAKDENQPPDVRQRAQAAAIQLRQLETSQTTQIAAEENRLRDEAEAKRKEDEAKAKEAEGKPKNGDERWVPIETKNAQGQTVRGVGLEVYTNGVWKYQPGSAKADTGFGAGPQGVPDRGPASQVITDGQGSYWTFDPYSKKIEALTGPKAGAKTVAGPDGSMYLQNPDGSLGQRLFEGLPQTYTTPDGFMVGIDRRNGSEVFRVDTKSKEGRELANRLERATVAAAEAGLEPKFSSAVAQYQQEVQRRQGLARTELQRLQDLQRSGQISPEQAEAQFDRWMATNVEGPLSGFRTAAEQERQKLEQENVTRTAAERARVQTANRARAQAGYEAGEAGRRLAMETNAGVRSRGFINDLAGLANSFSQGKTDFQFNPASFDPANFRSEQADINQVAQQAMQRLFGLVPEATENQVNAPLPEFPTGGDLRSLMDGVKYSGPLTGAPQNETPQIGAQDLGNGRARTVYTNGRYIDWDIPQTGGAAPQVAPPAPPSVAPPSLPGQLEGETPEQRAARWSAIMSQ